jgi:hypothetical protein
VVRNRRGPTGRVAKLVDPYPGVRCASAPPHRRRPVVGDPDPGLFSFRPLRDERLVDSCYLLLNVDFGDADGKVANAADHADAFCDADCSARIEHVEQVGAFQRQLIR